jgi:putative heme-binding domain-containing protein
MRRWIVCVGLFLLGIASFGVGSQNRNDPYAEHIAPGGPRTTDEERKAFHLPPGFEIQLVAAEPQIHKPMNIAFDDRGRLWVTESVEYPFPASGGKKGRDAIKILEDFGPDGRARKVSTFADGLNIPIGLLPFPHRSGSQTAIAYSIPDIWRLTDTEGQGQADRRDVFVGTFGHRDTHGMTNSFTWGFDGWIYATHGFSNTSTLKGSDGQAITLNSGNTYRMKPDGSHVEQFTWGQVNPFGLTFDPLGNLFSADCHTKPIMMLLRGGYYDSFGKPHDGLGYAPEMMGAYPDSTAIAGIAYYAADHFPRAYQDQVFIGDVVTCRVNEFRLQWRGSSPWATKHDFLRSDDRWFRPVDIKLGPDGALYVADFYNRIIGHYEVPLTHPGRDRERGRIWRIVYRGADGKGEPRAPRQDWSTATLADLRSDLAHPNLTVRMLAANQLVARGTGAIPAVEGLLHKDDALQRLHALWILERIQALDDRLLTSAAGDTDRAVRVHAMRVLSERRNWTPEQRGLALTGLKDKDAFVQRCAADALGRHPQPENLRALLDLRESASKEDTHLIHTARMAIRDTLRQATAWSHLPQPLSDRDRQALTDVALGVPTPEAGNYLFQQLQTFLQKNGEQQMPLAEIRHIARYAPKEETAKLIALCRTRKEAGAFGAFQMIDQGFQERGWPVDGELRAWGAGLVEDTLKQDYADHRLEAIRLAGRLRLGAVSDQLVALASNPQRVEAHRVAALESLAGMDGKKYTPLFGKLLADAREPVGLREQASHLLARLNHKEAQEQLAAALPNAPARLQTTIAADLAGSRTGGETLLTAVAAGKASARLLQERAVEVRLAVANIPRLKERIAKLTEGLPPADERLQRLFQQRRVGFTGASKDAAQGTRVFEKHCATCHQIAGKGAKIGPQLDGIGVRGLDRLLEDILDPNRNVDQAFRATTLALKNGQTVTGLLLKEEGEVLVLADSQGKEVRISKDTVEERAVSQLSPMPANLADQIPETEFYHLLAYLLEQRAPKESK